jgi:8-oxo-dGTP diphosphatase
MFGFDFEKLKVLVVRNKNADDPTNKQFSLPFEINLENVTLDQAALQIVRERSSLNRFFLEQIGAFNDPSVPSKFTSKPDLRKESNLSTITVAYYALIDLHAFNPTVLNPNSALCWKAVEEIDSMAFNHFEILQKAHQGLRSKLKSQPIGFNLLPEKFTFSQLHKLYEVIAGKEFDKRNFRRKMNKLGIVEKLNEKQKDVPHKPSSFYQFNLVNYQKLVESGIDNFGF